MLPTRILCPTDFSRPSFAAVDQAVELASHFKAELCLLHIIPFSQVAPPDLLVIAAPSDSERLNTASARLEEVVKARVPEGIQVSYEVKMGYAAKEIACAAQEGSFDWLVIATHGVGGWRHMVFGSVAEAIIRGAQCPVLTVHSQRDEQSQKDKMLPTEQEVGRA